MDVADAGQRQNSSREFWLVPGQTISKFVTPDARVCQTGTSLVGSFSEVDLADADFRFTPQRRHPAVNLCGAARDKQPPLSRSAARAAPIARRRLRLPMPIVRILLVLLALASPALAQDGARDAAAASAGEVSARRTRRILTMSMGNLNWHPATGAARAEVRDQSGCLSRAAPQRFTADGPLARAQANDRCAFHA